MQINELKPNILCLEYRQEKGDKDYGSCMWARFYFNLDRYELSIISDCGNYGYKWYETPKTESFLQLMARCDGGYILDKIYGNADKFNYEATKERFYQDVEEDETEIKERLDEIFDDMEMWGNTEDGQVFLAEFEKENDIDFCDVWEYLVYDYPANALKIVSVFEEHIKPKIREMVS